MDSPERGFAELIKYYHNMERLIMVRRSLLRLMKIIPSSVSSWLLDNAFMIS